jgi:hypothetical protein
MKKILILAMALSLAFVGMAQGASFVLSGNYLNVGVSNSGGLIDDAFTAGINFDPNGGGAYTAADFLTPGSPFEFFSIGYNGSFQAAGYSNGNTFGLTTLNTSGGTTYSALSYTTGTFTTTGGAVLTYNQSVWFDTTSNTINFSSQIINAGSSTLSGLTFARGLDPDQDVNQFGSYVTNNSIAGNTVTGSGPLTGLSITITDISGGGVPAVRASWSQDPTNLLLGGNDGNGDYTINMAWEIPDLAKGQSYEIDYSYTITAPIPGSLLLMGSGLLGLVGIGVRRKSA